MSGNTNTNPVVGTVIIARHGDRQGEWPSPRSSAKPRSGRRAEIEPHADLFSTAPGFYQSPSTYTATATAITPVGEVQEYQLGDLMRRTYAVSSNTQTYITGLSETDLTATQLNSTADGGGEGGVIFDSAIAFCRSLDGAKE